MQFLDELNDILKKHNLRGYLVGGFVRDYLLNKESHDIDIAISNEVEEIAKEFADNINGSFVVLDDYYDIYRVVYDDMIYDFTPIAGGSIQDDLFYRDFTINAMAIPITDIDLWRLHKDNRSARIIDPLGGESDIKYKIIRAMSGSTFKKDPLRLLRAIRFKAQLGFNIEPDTEYLIRKEAKRIKSVASERIHDELMKIARADNAADNFTYLEDEFSLLSILIPQIEQMKIIGECKYHLEDVWTHSLYTVEQVEALLEDAYWFTKITKEHLPLIKFAALFHDIGKLLTEEVIDGEVHFYGHDKEGADYIESILSELSFNNRQIFYVKRLIRYHMRPLALYYAENLTAKGKYRFFKAAEGWVADICLLAAADTLSTKLLNDRTEDLFDNLRFLRELIEENHQVEERTSQLLLDGNDLIEIFSLDEGPEIGKLLAKIEAAQAQGKINNRQEAIDYIKNIIK